MGEVTFSEQQFGFIPDKCERERERERERGRERERERERGGGGERETCLLATPRVGLQTYKVRITKYRLIQTGI